MSNVYGIAIGFSFGLVAVSPVLACLLFVISTYGLMRA